MRFLLIVLFPTFLLSQFQYQGTFQPMGMVNITDGSDISLPFRVTTLDLGYTFGNIDFIVNSALEIKWSDSNYLEPQLREAYIAYYPFWGEFRIGKQIHSWGIADGNNPTDNINAYDYYYLFSPDTERKLGSLSMSATYYLENWQLQAVVIPEHTPNRLVIDEPDFPLSKDSEDIEDMNISSINEPLEFGLSGTTTLGESDLTLSYFNGYDRGFSLIQFSPNSGNMDFGYKNTQMFGLNLLGFWNDFTYRCEVAYFDTKNDDGDISAQYYQGVYQLEYTTESELILNSQLIHQYEFSLKGTTNFEPGMGTPFAMFSDQALMLSAKQNFMDDSLELSAMAFINLEDNGYMIGGSADYTITGNFKFESSLTKFSGDGMFKSLDESFSHIKLGIKYTF
jgi:hypothetical protein